MVMFWILWSIDVVLAAVAGGFFLRGLRHGASPRYFTAWLRVFGILGAALLGGLGLYCAGLTVVGTVLAAIPATIGGAYGGFLLLLLTNRGGRWN